MSRTVSLSLVGLVTLIGLAAGCSRPDRPETTSASSDASTPVVSGVSTDTSASTTTSVSVKPVTFQQAESTYEAGEFAEATRLFSSYTETRPENPWGHYMLGVSAWKSGDRDRALSAFDRSIELDPTHQKSLFNSSRVLLELSRPQEALERIERALEQDSMSTEGLRLLGRTYYQLGQVDEAIEAYRRALATDDQDVWSMNNLGLIYIDQGRASEALLPLARAVQLRGNSPVFHNNLGMALERSGHPVAAAKAFESALSADSTYQKASVALARVTGGGQEPEPEPVDLNLLAQQFQAEIEGWRGSDSTDAAIQPVNDSTTSSIEARSDTLESSEQGE